MIEYSNDIRVAFLDAVLAKRFSPQRIIIIILRMKVLRLIILNPLTKNNIMMFINCTTTLGDIMTKLHPASFLIIFSYCVMCSLFVVDMLGGGCWAGFGGVWLCWLENNRTGNGNQIRSQAHPRLGYTP